MPKVYKVAGQSIPAANTDTLLYTSPALTSFIQSTLTVCNQDVAGVIAAFRIAVVPSAETLAAKHYLVFDQLIDFRATKQFTLGFTLAAGDKVYVRSSTAGTSFSLFGCEAS